MYSATTDFSVFDVAVWRGDILLKGLITNSRSGPDGYTAVGTDCMGHTATTVQGSAVVDSVYAVRMFASGQAAETSMPHVPGAAANQIFWTTYTYDGLGRTLTSKWPDGASTTTYSYAGNTTTVTDPAGKWKTFTNDVEGNLVTVTEPNPAGCSFTTTYSYDWANDCGHADLQPVLRLHLLQRHHVPDANAGVQCERATGVDWLERQHDQLQLFGDTE